MKTTFGPLSYPSNIHKRPHLCRISEPPPPSGSAHTTSTKGLLEVLHADKKGLDYMPGLVQTSTEATGSPALSTPIVRRDFHGLCTSTPLHMIGAQPAHADGTWYFWYLYKTCTTLCDKILMTSLTEIAVGPWSLSWYLPTQMGCP